MSLDMAEMWRLAYAMNNKPCDIPGHEYFTITVRGDATDPLLRLDNSPCLRQLSERTVVNLLTDIHATVGLELFPRALVPAQDDTPAHLVVSIIPSDHAFNWKDRLSNKKCQNVLATYGAEVNLAPVFSKRAPMPAQAHFWKTLVRKCFD